MQEQWFAVPGYVGLYEISALGRIRSLDRYVRGVSKTGTTHVRRRKGRVLTPHLRRDKYLQVALSREGIATIWLVHRLIATVLLEKPPEAVEVNHLNGVKADNRRDNLAWCTAKQNTQHAVQTGLHKAAKGERQGHAKLTDEKVREIRKRLGEGAMVKQIAAEFGVSTAPISYIKNNLAWTHVKAF